MCEMTGYRPSNGTFIAGGGAIKRVAAGQEWLVRRLGRERLVGRVDESGWWDGWDVGRVGRETGGT
jgi:hypothetical protein